VNDTQDFEAPLLRGKRLGHGEKTSMSYAIDASVDAFDFLSQRRAGSSISQATEQTMTDLQPTVPLNFNGRG
jgi:hypothetical protein